MIPGETRIEDGEIELNAGRKTVAITVTNTGDRPIQVGSHYHFFETNPALKFERKKARGMRLDIAAGTAVRFEPGQQRTVELVEIGGQVPAISPKWIRQIGIRSVDEGERRFVHEQDLEVFDMRFIDEMGMRHAMELALATLDAHTHLHVSFDVDFLDPDIAPGVGTTVPGGPTYREAQLCMEMIADTGRMGSLDVVELNPALDVRNKTAQVAVDLIESLFGKSTLMRPKA